MFYIRGGFQNQAGLTPLNGDCTVQANFQGDDDHPGYSDSQLSEALVAREINAIASSPYWNQCAIIITYDESEGDYDHVPPQIIAYDPNALALTRGPRIPLLVISPYARAHTISHETRRSQFGNQIYRPDLRLDTATRFTGRARGPEAGRNTLSSTKPRSARRSKNISGRLDIRVQCRSPEWCNQAAVGELCRDS